MSATTRTHIIVPKRLIGAVDEMVGSRGRSRFFVEAAERELARRRLAAAAAEAAGAFGDADVPGWESPEAVSEWVRALREEDEGRLERMSNP